jgi:hypothetical protein
VVAILLTKIHSGGYGTDGGDGGRGGDIAMTVSELDLDLLLAFDWQTKGGIGGEPGKHGEPGRGGPGGPGGSSYSW